MSAAFADAMGLTSEQSDCFARSVVEGVGLPRLQEIGMFDQDLAWVDVDLADAPDVKQAFSVAVATCILPS